MLLQNYFMLNSGLLRFTVHIVHPKTVIVISWGVLCMFFVVVVVGVFVPCIFYCSS